MDYEYATFEHTYNSKGEWDTTFEDWVNEICKDGWELVTKTDQRNRYVFRRLISKDEK